MNGSRSGGADLSGLMGQDVATGNAVARNHLGGATGRMGSAPNHSLHLACFLLPQGSCDPIGAVPSDDRAETVRFVTVWSERVAEEVEAFLPSIP